MLKVNLKALILFITLLILSGCNDAQEPKGKSPKAAVPGNVSDQQLLEEVEIIFLPCQEDSPPPVVISPDHEIVDPNPPTTLNWLLTCVPTEILLVHGMTGDTNDPLLILEEIGGDAKEYIITFPLLPATTYNWGVAADTLGGNALVTSGTYTTGPICDLNTLMSPTLITPEDGVIYAGIIIGGGDIVLWTYIGYPDATCTPEEFTIFVSTNPDFSGPNLNEETPGPYYRINSDGVRIIKDVTEGIEDCTTYYWRARASVGGNDGPFSETFTFYTDFEGKCLHFMEFKGIKDANCRSNPWINGNEVGIIRKGDTAILLGLNEDAWWGKFKLMNDLECWVHMSAVEFQPPGALFPKSWVPILLYDPKPAEKENVSDASPACMAPDSTGVFICQSPCPDPRYAARVCDP